MMICRLIRNSNGFRHCFVDLIISISPFKGGYNLTPLTNLTSPALPIDMWKSKVTYRSITLYRSVVTEGWGRHAPQVGISLDL
jgi:hypothetical protein